MRSFVSRCGSLYVATLACLWLCVACCALPGWCGPDLQIRDYAGTEVLGDGIYNTTGSGQSFTKTILRSTAVSYVVTIQNEGDAAATFTITGPAGGDGWEVHYYGSTSSEITTQVTGAGWTTPTINPGASSSMAFSVIAGSNAMGTQQILLTASDGTNSDTVQATTISQAVTLTTTRISVTSGGIQGDNISWNPAISGNGRYVAFQTSATTLGGNNNVLLSDTTTNTLEVVSRNSAGTIATNNCIYPCVSQDGRYVVFSTLTPGFSTNEYFQVFIRDRQANTTQCVSLSATGEQGNANSGFPGNLINPHSPTAISADGQYVAFTSMASNIVTGDTNEVVDVFVRDRVTNTTECISIDQNGNPAGGEWCTISADGRYVAFQSTSANLVEGDTDTIQDIFVYDRTAHVMERFIPSPIVRADSSYPAISGDGRYVVYSSASMGVTDVLYRVDRQTGLSALVTPTMVPGILTSIDPYGAISADGRYIAFVSNSNLFAPGDTNGRADVFVRDMQTGSTQRVSMSTEGTGGNDDAAAGVAISANGRYVAYASNASNLVAGDTNGKRDIFITDRGAAPEGVKQPDLHIDNAGEDAPAGDNIYTADGEGQTKTQGAFAGETAVYDITLENDGSGPDSFTVVGDGSDLPPVAGAKPAAPKTAMLEVLSYVKYSDLTATNREYQKTLNGISTFYTNYHVTQTSTTDPAALAAALVGKDIFLIPALNLSPYPTQETLEALGSSFSAVLQEFVAEGGLVVCCNQYYQGQYFLNSTGLLHLSTYEQNAGITVTVTNPTHPITEGLPATFTGLDATAQYTITDPDAQTLIAYENRPVVAVRAIGLGHVVQVGFDYFQTNAYENRVIANAIRWGESHALDALPWTVTYTDDEGTDITAAVTGDGWTSPMVAAGGRLTLHLSVTPGVNAGPDDEKTVLVTATSTGDPTRSDTARAVTTVPTPVVDALISVPGGAYQGDNIYNTSGEDQQATVEVVRPETAVYLIKLQNDGLAPDTLRVTGTSSSSGWTVAYFNAPEGGVNITAQVTGEGWTTPELDSGSEMIIRAEITPAGGGMPIPDTNLIAVTVASLNASAVTDTVTAITTASSSPRPDVLIRIAGDPASLGDGIWNADGAGQTKTGYCYTDHAATYLITVHNDGSTGGSFLVTGTGDSDGWTVAYFDAAEGGEDITADVTGEGWLTPSFGSGIFPVYSSVIRAVVTPTTAAPGTGHTLQVTATSREEPVRADTVKGVTAWLALTAVTLAAEPASPGFVGVPVTLRATPIGGTNVEYRFFVSKEAGVWTPLRGYGTSPTVTSTPEALGTYTLLVWAREVGSPRQKDCSATLTYHVNPPLAGVSLAVKPATVGPTDSPVTLTATATGGARVEFAFFQQRQGDTGWTMVQDFGLTRTCAWTPATAGQYTLRAQAREAGTTAPLFLAERPFTVLPRLTAVSLAVAPSSSQQIGHPVTLTATATGGVAVTYRFFVQRKGDMTFTPLGGYTSSPTALWTPSASGQYTLLVWARETGSTAAKDAHATRAYLITPAPVTGVTLQSNLAAPQAATTTITLTAAATGAATAEYRFFVQRPGSTAWTPLRAYGTTPTCSWRPIVEGTHTLLVWSRAVGSLSAHEAHAQMTYAVTAAGPLRGVNLFTNVTSPQPLSTAITLSAENVGGTSVQFRFQAAYPSNSPSGWAMETIRDYSTEPTCTWTPSAARTYLVTVYARDTGTNAVWQTYNMIAFRITGGTVPVLGPTSVTLTASPDAPQPLGTPVTFTATVTGGENPVYFFQRTVPSGTGWSSYADVNYTSVNYRTWTLPEARPYAIVVFVRDASSALPWQVYDIIPYQMTSP